MPLKAWIKAALDHAIQISMKQPDLEFVWVGDDAIDPLQQAQTLVALVGAGIKTREEARAELGLGGEGKALGKYSPDQPRDDRGRWTSEGGGDSPSGVGNNEGSGADNPDQATTSGGSDEGAGVAGGATTHSSNDTLILSVSERPEDDQPITPAFQAELDALREAPIMQAGLTPTEASITNDALKILESPTFRTLVKANSAGVPAEVKINGYVVVYEPELPENTTLGMALFGENGFVLGPSALANREDTIKTILHEMYRLRTSALSANPEAEVDGELVRQESRQAYRFADKAFKVLTGSSN